MPKFVYYQLLSDVFRKQVEVSWSFGTQENIGMGVLGRITISLPPITEQQAIADYLDQETQRLDQLKANLNQQINVLSDYKKSLIYECVTGKKRVINAA